MEGVPVSFVLVWSGATRKKRSISLLKHSIGQPMVSLNCAVMTTNTCRSRREASIRCSASLADYSGRGVIVGLNQYSHDASCCVVDAESGEILMAIEKERLTRVRHDGGPTGECLRACLSALDLELDDVRLVVANNHHFRIAPFERRLPFQTKLGIYPTSDYADAWNLTRNIPKLEISHHLAHAWSVLPFWRASEDAVIVVMDGMGEAYKDLTTGNMSTIDEHDSDYVCDWNSCNCENIREFPTREQILSGGRGYREAETVFLQERQSETGRLQCIFKRWTEERSPPELYNHGFENMESLGAVYSRISSHIFGHWNVCGKVMGLAPLASTWQSPIPPQLFQGSLWDGDLKIDWKLLETLPNPGEWSSEHHHRFYAGLASRVQTDLEHCVLEFLQRIRTTTGANTLYLAGGVALNSTLNGKILRESGFEHVRITPFPGDEGSEYALAQGR
mmetsp:Transcript_1046/g.2243  ORF Transcript_1046/g.2243 Transcript_1046/m.2243 type:complete len:449 (-) Transcript_1046:2281-3627(-)